MWDLLVRVNTTIPDPVEEGAISKEKLEPGDLVSMHYMTIKELGRTFTSRGKESKDKMYKAATIFVDSASGNIQLKFQCGFPLLKPSNPRWNLNANVSTLDKESSLTKLIRVLLQHNP